MKPKERKPKKERPMPTNNFYVAESLVNEGIFVVGLDEFNEPIWSEGSTPEEHYENAEWSNDESKVQEYINRFEINAKPKNPGFNYPPSKPPLA